MQDEANWVLLKEERSRLTGQLGKPRAVQGPMGALRGTGTKGVGPGPAGASEMSMVEGSGRVEGEGEVGVDGERIDWLKRVV